MSEPAEITAIRENRQDWVYRLKPSTVAMLDAALAYIDELQGKVTELEAAQTRIARVEAYLAEADRSVPEVASVLAELDEALAVPSRCTREGLTPVLPDNKELVVDCSVHGEIGRIPAGDDEYGRAEELFTAHVAAVPSAPGGAPANSVGSPAEEPQQETPATEAAPQRPEPTWEGYGPCPVCGRVTYAIIHSCKGIPPRPVVPVQPEGPDDIDLTPGGNLAEYPKGELPGMWEEADFIGGATDAERIRNGPE